jgi:hypothetical protein
VNVIIIMVGALMILEISGELPLMLVTSPVILVSMLILPVGLVMILV